MFYLQTKQPVKAFICALSIYYIDMSDSTDNLFLKYENMKLSFIISAKKHIVLPLFDLNQV